MNAARDLDESIARIASAIGEPARARMLCCLLDNRARTSTELALVAEVNASTASAHLSRLKAEGLVSQTAQGKHWFYSLHDDNVASVLEKLNVLAGGPTRFVPTTPDRLRAARTCYDHTAGALGVALHDRFMALEWIVSGNVNDDRVDAYNVTAKGVKGFSALNVNVIATQQLRRRFAFACLDWSERRSHLGGALGAAVLSSMLEQKWIAKEHDRVIRVTAVGKRELQRQLGV